MKLTKQQISELTDTQLNRAMLDNYMSYWNSDKDILKAVKEGDFNFLKDWNLLIPIAHKNNLCIEMYNKSDYPHDTCEAITMQSDGVFKSDNPARAICEALVYLKAGV